MSLLEIIACSVADAVAAEQGGADRIELISHFEVGGLTPSLDLTRAVLATVRIPVRVMLRANAGFAVSDEVECDRLAADALAFAQLPVDGLVLGFLSQDQIDMETMAGLLARAPHVHATFHRAFEALPDPVAAVARLKTFPQIDRILTSGGDAPWPEKVAGLAALARAAQPEISILLGGGVDARAIALIRANTGIREFHVGRAARDPAAIDAPVSIARVAALKQLVG